MTHWLIEFPRLNQLYERIGPLKADNVLQSYIQLGTFCPLERKHAEWFEGNLARLDSDAWEHLIKKVLPYSCNKRTDRGWEEFWDHLNESRGYVLLEDRGYERVCFIKPEESKKGQNYEFADLIGESSASRAILEVKTINRSDDDRKRNDPTFWAGKSDRPGDIRDLFVFLKRLRDQSNPVSVFLWEQLSEPNRRLLASGETTSSNIKRMKLTLVHLLNEVIKGKCIYEKDRFRHAVLRTTTSGYMDENPQGTGLVYLNRWLLEDAYPNELAKLPSLVVDIRPDMPVPPKFKEMVENAIKAGRNQITATLKQLLERNEPPVDKQIVLLVINRDIGCSAVSLKQLEAALQQPDLEVVCQVGDI